MCMQCMASAMTSMAAATGTRAWLGRRYLSWLTPARLRTATIALFSAALIASALLMSGSTAPVTSGHLPHAASAQTSR
jgi:hypothetical protein